MRNLKPFNIGPRAERSVRPIQQVKGTDDTLEIKRAGPLVFISVFDGIIARQPDGTQPPNEGEATGRPICSQDSDDD